MYRHWKHHFEFPVSPVAIVLALLAGIITRVMWIRYYGISLNADGAAFGLMAQHIAQGKSFPLFFMGQRYMSALPAYVLAPLYWLPLKATAPFELYAMVTSIAFLLILTCLASALLGTRVALYTALLMIFPPYYLFIWFFGVHGYQPVVILGLAYMWAIAGWLRNTGSRRRAYLYLSACLAGFGWYAHPLFVYFLLLFAVLAVCNGCFESHFTQIKKVIIDTLIWTGLFLCGSGLYWAGQLVSADTYNPVSSLTLAPAPLLENTKEWLTAYMPALLSLDHGISWFKMLCAVCYAAVMVYTPYLAVRWITLWRRGQVYMGLMFVILLCAIAAVFVCTRPLQSVVELRHLTPLITVWAVVIALCLNKIPRPLRFMRYVVISIILIHNITSAVNGGVKSPDYSSLIKFLAEHRLNHGFASYWLGYPVTYLSGESVILAPFGQIGRHIPYMIDAAGAPDTAYVFDTDDAAQLAMMNKFRGVMRQASITCQEHNCQEFSVFHNLRTAHGEPVDFFVPIDPEFVRIERTNTNVATAELIVPDGLYTVVPGAVDLRRAGTVQATGNKLLISFDCNDTPEDNGFVYRIRN